MYKKIILLFICGLLTLSAHTQGFKGGGHIGFLATQVDGDNHAGYKKIGLFAGIFTNYSFANEKMCLQFELNYAQKGSKFMNAFRISLHQVEPTVLFRFNFVNTNFFADAGLSFNVLADAKIYVNQELVYGSHFYRFNADAVVGLGYRFQEHWGGSIRFSYSSPIGMIAKTKNDRPVEGYIFNNCLLLRFFYQFQQKSKVH